MYKGIFFTIVFTLLSCSSFARNCDGGLQNTFSLENFQGFISISETDSQGKTYRKVNGSETILVPKLTHEIFHKIKESPQDIANMFGAKLISEDNANNFRLGIPILGFDLTFDVELNELDDDTIRIELKNFNTFFHKGSATLKVNSFDQEGAELLLNGHALVPKGASTLFIYGVGGEENFKDLLQSETDKQIAAALERFKSYIKK